jgi:hypothetical protein
MANLTGKQIERFCDALLAVFDRSELEQLTRIDLEENLEAIAGAGKLSVVVFELVTWAQRTGRVGDLLDAARTCRPTNAALTGLAQELGITPAAKPDAPPSTPGSVSVGKIEAVNAAIGGTQIIDQRGATFNIGGTKIDTGGGAYVGGGVETGGGDFVGRDATTNAPPTVSIDALLFKLAATVALKVPPADLNSAMAQVTAMQTELAKGKEADDAKLAAAVRALLAIAPDAVVAAISDPIVAGEIGPVTQYVLTRHGAK